ncbi:DUF6390 family protein [Patescibacteria group bacterium]
MALKPNELGYCGRDSAPAKFRRCIMGGDCEGVSEEVEKFIVLNPYIKTIATVTGKDKFSYEVLEAYWFGNDLLDDIDLKHYGILLGNLQKQGVPQFLIDEIRRKKPSSFVPIHLFNILHVGVGRASGSVPFNLESINNCMVRWGEVLKIENEEVLVGLRSLNKKKEVVVEKVKQKHSIDLVGSLRKGDKVLCHWGWVAKKTNPEEVERISFWTKKLLESLA